MVAHAGGTSQKGEGSRPRGQVKNTDEQPDQRRHEEPVYACPQPAAPGVSSPSRASDSAAPVVGPWLAAGLLLVSAMGGAVFALAATADNLLSGPWTELATIVVHLVSSTFNAALLAVFVRDAGWREQNSLMETVRCAHRPRRIHGCDGN